MKTAFFRHKHPVEGEIKFETDDRTVYFSCWWPFDLATDNWDEWTTISNEFLLTEFRSKIKSMKKGLEITISGLLGGSISLKIVDSQSIQLIAKQSGEEFPITLPATKDDLFPTGNQTLVEAL